MPSKVSEIFICTISVYVFFLLLLFSMLLISRSKDLWKILMFNWWTVVSIFFDLQLPPLAQNIFSCFSNHLGAVFFFSFHFRHLSMTSWRRQFLLRIWPIQLAFLRRILFRSVLFSPIRSRTCSLIGYACKICDTLWFEGNLKNLFHDSVEFVRTFLQNVFTSTVWS